MSRWFHLGGYLGLHDSHPIIVLIFALFAVPLLALVAILWRRALLLALPLLTILNGLPLTVGGSSVRVDQLAACLLLVPLSASILSGTRRLRTDSTTWWLAAILALNVASSLMNSPARGYSLSQCANLASSWVIYVVLLNFLETREDLETFFRGSLWAAIAASAIGIIAFCLAIIGLPVGGADVSASALTDLTSAFGARGTLLEANIFGSLTGAYLVVALALLALAPRLPSAGIPVRLLRWTATLTATGLLLSFTRSAWIGTLVGIGFATLLAMWTVGFRVRRIALPLAIGTAVVVGFVLLPGSVGTFLRFKLFNLLNLSSQTASLRLVMYTFALQQTLAHPVLGWGTFTFAPLFAEGSDFAQFAGWKNLWIGNYLVLALHDTGVVGLALWIGMLASIVLRGVRATRRLRAADPLVATRTLALTSATVTLLITFLATTGFSLGFPWLLTGLLGAFARAAEEPVPERLPVRSREEPPLLAQPDAIL